MFYGVVLEVADEGEQLMEEGKIREAIAKYKLALVLHNQPSRVLENRIGLAYFLLGEDASAIVHYSNAIQIKDNSLDRVGRGQSYMYSDQCDMAMTDARVALAMEPAFDVGIHTDVDANYILSDCYFWDEEYLLSLQHIEAAIDIAKEHEYSDEEVSILEEEREIIKSYLE